MVPVTAGRENVAPDAVILGTGMLTDIAKLPDVFFAKVIAI